MLTPGAAHPEAPQALAAIATRLRVLPAVVQQWCDQGLECRAGLIDPFAALTWASWAGTAATVVQTRWQRYVAWMTAPGAFAVQHGRVQRRHRVYLPPVTTLKPPLIEWWLPPLDGLHQPTVVPDSAWLYRTGPSVNLQHQVELHPAGAAADDELLALVAEVVGGFRYGYRHHDPRELPAPTWRDHGTCLDACLSLALLLEHHHHPWRLRAGVTASTTFANPHFWLECALAAGGWTCLDPTLGAIARMCAMDWRALLPRCAGPRDTRRVACDTSTPPAAANGVEGFIGVVHVDGQPATACMDWVCGACTWRFALTAPAAGT